MDHRDTYRRNLGSGYWSWFIPISFEYFERSICPRLSRKRIYSLTTTHIPKKGTKSILSRTLGKRSLLFTCKSWPKIWIFHNLNLQCNPTQKLYHYYRALNIKIHVLKHHVLHFMHSMDNITTDSSNKIIIITVLITINSNQKVEDFMLQTIVFNILLLQVITQAHNHHPKK